jgi:hypothetical protein
MDGTITRSNIRGVVDYYSHWKGIRTVTKRCASSCRPHRSLHSMNGGVKLRTAETPMVAMMMCRKWRSKVRFVSFYLETHWYCQYDKQIRFHNYDSGYPPTTTRSLDWTHRHAAPSDNDGTGLQVDSQPGRQPCCNTWCNPLPAERPQAVFSWRGFDTLMDSHKPTT